MFTDNAIPRPDDNRVATGIRFLLVVKIIKFALPLAAVICFSAAAPVAVAADSTSKKKSSSSASAKKKSSNSKKSSKSGKSSQARKGKSKSSTAKKKGKTERRTTTVKTETSSSWVDELPEVELPTMSGPAEEELLEPVETIETESDEVESDPEP